MPDIVGTDAEFRVTVWNAGAERLYGYSALTDCPLGVVKAIPGHGDNHGDVDAVRRANSYDPRRKISNGKPAVRPAAAAT